MATDRSPLLSKLFLKKPSKMTVATKKTLLEVRKMLRPNWYRCPIGPVAFRRLMRHAITKVGFKLEAI